ncbi:MAG TPA: beta-L-arabinofuranosidase domain-containing protein [Planctomycetota bacterium]|jgi:hypothetical protein
MNFSLVLVIALCLCMSLQCLAGEKVEPKAQPFELTQVRLLDGPFKDATELDRKYLHDLDADRLLHTFRLNAGLPSTAKPYGGWEAPKCELRGHFLGHYLSACALMYASTGDEKLREKANYIVAELAKCQEALASKGFGKGYLSAYPESFIDRVVDAKPVWAPWYTLHKIYAGLIDVHHYCGNAQALDVVKGMAAWAKSRLDKLDDAGVQKMLGNEHGGMNETIANLYGITGDPDHLSLAQRFNHKFIFDPLAKAEDKLNGLHANTQIPKIIGAAREYELTGNSTYKDVASFFWQRVALKRSYAIGGHSDREHFFPIEEFSKHLGTDTCETCNTYNMLKLTRHLFAWEPNAEAMDFYERALYNHILASQDPKTGQIVYLMSLKPGHFKTYSTPDDSFWCCSGTGIENHAKYADTIYFHSADSLFVNLFIPSELNWKEKGLVLEQNTKFPESDKTKLKLKCKEPLTLSLSIRCPFWVQNGASISVNGKPEDVALKPGSYVTLKRRWRDGDEIEVRLPMALRLEGMPDNPKVVAICYGPVVLAGEMGTENMPASLNTRGQCDLNNNPSPEAPVFLSDAASVLSKIQPTDKPLVFKTNGLAQPRDLTLIPFHQMHHQRYSVYWSLYTEEEWQKRKADLAAAEARRKALEARRVDVVHPGEQQPETDHAMKGEHTSAGPHAGRKWRHATDGGWFSYEMKVVQDTALSLCCTYWGSDSLRTFDILINDQKIATQKIDHNKPNEFFDVEYPIPPDLLKGKDKITVKFQAHPGNTAGGVFGCAILKP